MDDRTVLRISGEDRIDFLQGLVTNDAVRAETGLVYAALLSAQGKYLVDFFLAPDPSGDAILLDVAADAAEDLLKRLNMYRLRAKVAIDVTDIAVTRGTGPAPEGAHPDPRHTALGWRSYAGAPAQDADWTALRVRHLIPEHGVELRPNETYILEAGFERLSGVDFRKGCYVGQEVTARMKHKTELKKGLARVSVDGPADPGDEITAGGKPAGMLHSRSGDAAIAFLRFDRAKGTMVAGDASISMAD